MKPWYPIAIAAAITVFINAFPIFMAFVVADKGWIQTGWVMYFFTIPASVLIIIVGALTTAWLYNKK